MRKPVLKSCKKSFKLTVTHDILQQTTPLLIPWEWRGWRMKMHLGNRSSSGVGPFLKSRLVNLLVWTIQVCVNTMPRTKGISNDLREAIVAACQSDKGFMVSSKKDRVHHSTVRWGRLFTCWKHFRQMSVLPASLHPMQCLEQETVATYQTLQISVSLLDV